MWCCCKYHMLYHLFLAFLWTLQYFSIPWELWKPELGMLVLCDCICFGCRVNEEFEGAKKGLFQQLPHGHTVLLREAEQPWLHCSYSFFLGPQSILFSTFSIFFYTPRSTKAPSSQHWEFNDYLPQPQMFFKVPESRITSLRMVFIFWFHNYNTKSSFCCSYLPLILLYTWLCKWPNIFTFFPYHDK